MLAGDLETADEEEEEEEEEEEDVAPPVPKRRRLRGKQSGEQPPGADI